MATPHVSGAAALVWSRPGVTSNSQVVEILLNSADRAGVDTARLDTWTIHGGLNIHDALTYGAPVNLPPIANAGADQTVTADASGTVNVALNGSASSDPDGTIQSYQWNEGSIVVATGATPAVPLPVGEHTLTLRVTDDGGATDSDTVLITILAAPPQGDDVSILKASYQPKRGQLTIEATSTGAPDVALVAYDASSGATLGSLAYNRKKRIYAATFKLPSAPAAVRVVSSGGGSDTASVAGG
jgi:hypothetical protein